MCFLQNTATPGISTEEAVGSVKCEEETAGNTGKRLWIISEETSKNGEPNPSAQIPAGNARHAARSGLWDDSLFEARPLIT